MTSTSLKEHASVHVEHQFKLFKAKNVEGKERKMKYCKLTECPTFMNEVKNYLISLCHRVIYWLDALGIAIWPFWIPTPQNLLPFRKFKQNAIRSFPTQVASLFAQIILLNQHFSFLQHRSVCSDSGEIIYLNYFLLFQFISVLIPINVPRLPCKCLSSISIFSCFFNFSIYMTWPESRIPKALQNLHCGKRV